MRTLLITLLALLASTPLLAQEGDIIAARENLSACKTLLDAGEPCKALGRCHRALDGMTTQAVLELTRDAQRACRITLPKETPDDDQDGLPNTVDRCPEAAEDADGFLDEDGCPDTDNDNDGILDVDDLCATTPEDADGFLDTDGCPELDNDGDGIEDANDTCANIAEDLDGFQDSDGCPEFDNDVDGVVDRDDRCPNQPEDADGFEDGDGCPELDNDGDNLPDDRDACPNLAEDIDGVDDTDGCPDEDPDILPWIAMGGGGALIVTGITLQILAAVEEQAVFDVETNNGLVDTMTQRSAAQRIDRANLLQGFAITTLGLGAAAVTAGVLLLVLDDDEDVVVAPEVTSEGGGVRVRLVF